MISDVPFDRGECIKMILKIFVDFIYFVNKRQ